MATSFTLSPPKPIAHPPRRRVLVTGANGRIGRSFTEYAGDRYDITLLVRDAEAAASMPGSRPCDLTDPACTAEACEGIDTVVHLAADASANAVWGTLLRDNIEATHNVLVAAVHARCRRVIFASSIHAVSGYPIGYQVHPEDPVNPGDLYGVTKCFGEALCRMTAEQHGLSCIVLRIGAFQPLTTAENPDQIDLMDAFISERDLDQLICRCIDDQSVHFAIFHALSNNRFNRLDISLTQELIGFEPQDDFTEINPALSPLNLRGKARPHNAREGKGRGLAA